MATERLEEFCAVHPEAVLQPDPALFIHVLELDRDKALVELLRSRLSGWGRSMPQPWRMTSRCRKLKWKRP